MCSTAGFHADLASWLNLLLQNFEPFLTFQLAFPYRLLIAVDAMCLKNIFCQIYANSDNLHGGLLLPFNWLIEPPVWHIDAVKVRRSPSHCFQVFRTVTFDTNPILKVGHLNDRYES